MVAVRRKWFTGLALQLVAAPLLADWQINMPEGVTPISTDVYELHMAVIAICTGIGLAVYGALTFIIVRYRRSKGAVAATFDENTKIEVLWTLAPLLLLIAIATPATIVLRDMDDYAAADVTVKITGHQWSWQYQYLDQGIQYFSNLSTPQDQLDGTAAKGQWYLLEVDRPLVLPVGKKVRFLVTSGDVIHSWWVPTLGVKRDAIPGFIHEAWARIEKPGTYRGQCAELCGVHHAFMPIVVEAVSAADFDKWVKTTATRTQTGHETLQDRTMQSVLARGNTLYDQHCAECHKKDGSGLPPTFPPLKGSSIAVGTNINRHIDLVLHGVPGSAMQAFAEQLDDEELAAIITYERNAWGNNTGDLVTPADVQALRR